MLILALTGQTAYVRVRNFTAFLPHNFRKELLSALGSKIFGGKRGARTLAPGKLTYKFSKLAPSPTWVSLH